MILVARVTADLLCISAIVLASSRRVHGGKNDGAEDSAKVGFILFGRQHDNTTTLRWLGSTSGNEAGLPSLRKGGGEHRGRGTRYQIRIAAQPSKSLAGGGEHKITRCRAARASTPAPSLDRHCASLPSWSSRVWARKVRHTHGHGQQS